MDSLLRGRRSPITLFIFVVLIHVTWSGCSGVRRTPEGQDEPPPDDGLQRSWRLRFSQLDALVVFDSTSMTPDTRAVAAERLGAAVESLIRLPEDLECDHCVPIEDVHLGIVDARGDGRILLGGDSCQPSSRARDCESGECGYLSHLNQLTSDGCEPMRSPLIPDLQCIISSTRSEGASSRPLDVVLQALSVHSARGGANEGFMRERSLVLILFVTAGDDESEAEGGGLRPVEEFVQELEMLRPDWSNHYAVGLIGGFPTDGYSWHLGDPVENLEYLAPSPTCESHLFTAFAPSRLTRFLYSFQHRAMAASICDDDWSSATSWLLSYILPGIIYGPSCPMATLTEPGPCRLVETLPDDGPCPHDIIRTAGRSCGPGWHRDLGLDAQGRRRCEILPSDRDGDDQPDLLEGNSPESCIVSEERWDTSGCIPGWFYLPYDSYFYEDDRRGVDLTWGSPEVRMSPRAVLQMECDPSECA